MNHALNGDPVAGNILSSYEDYGCKVNAISPEELFQRYEQAGFLYPAKKQRLAPFLSLVKENWRKALRGGELILYIVSHENRTEGDWAAVVVWRTTNSGVQSQHLVSGGGPTSSRAVLLATQAMFFQEGCNDASGQNWFRPENRFPARVFGTLGETIGTDHSSVATFNLFSWPLRSGTKANAEVYITKCTTAIAKSFTRWPQTRADRSMLTRKSLPAMMYCSTQ